MFKESLRMKLPCGCEMEKQGNAFMVKPCSLTCEYYLYVLEQSKRKNTPVIYMKVGEKRDNR